MYSRLTDSTYKQPAARLIGRPAGLSAGFGLLRKGAPGAAVAAPGAGRTRAPEVVETNHRSRQRRGKTRSHHPHGIVPFRPCLGQGYREPGLSRCRRGGIRHGPSRERFRRQLYPLGRGRAAACPPRRWQEASREASPQQADRGGRAPGASRPPLRRQWPVSVRAPHARTPLGTAPRHPWAQARHRPGSLSASPACAGATCRA